MVISIEKGGDDEVLIIVMFGGGKYWEFLIKMKADLQE